MATLASVLPDIAWAKEQQQACLGAISRRLCQSASSLSSCSKPAGASAKCALHHRSSACRLRQHSEQKLRVTCKCAWQPPRPQQPPAQWVYCTTKVQLPTSKLKMRSWRRRTRHRGGALLLRWLQSTHCRCPVEVGLHELVQAVVSSPAHHDFEILRAVTYISCNRHSGEGSP